MRLVAVTLNKHDEMLGCGAQMYLGHVCVCGQLGFKFSSYLG